MRGYLRERRGRPGYYELVVEASRDPVTKKRRQVRKGFRGSKAAAEKALRALAREVDEGKHRATDGTVAFLLERWLDDFGPDLSPTTLKEYRRLIDKRIVPAIGNVALRDLDVATLDGLYGRLRKTLAPASVRQVHAVIRRALNQALDWNWIDANVAYKAHPPKLRKHELTPPDPDDVLRMLALADETDLPFGAFLRLAARTGARRGELCALRWSSVDLEAGTLLISRSAALVDGAVILKDTKTHAARRISLGETTEIVRRHIERMRARANGEPLARDPFLFSDCLGCCHPWDPELATRKFAALRKRAGLTTRLHDLRHAHASQLGAGGVDIRTIAGRLGHSQPSTTLNMYSHFLEVADQKAAEVTDEVYREPGREQAPGPEAEGSKHQVAESATSG